MKIDHLMLMHSLVPLIEFNQNDDIVVVPLSEKNQTNHQECVYIRYIFHQISLVIFIILYLILGGFCFAYIESNDYLEKYNEKLEIIHKTHENIRLYAIQLLNEQLNEDFEKSYHRWRWGNKSSLSYVSLSIERSYLLDNRTEFELENLFSNLHARQVSSDKFVYKWTYSTAILYAATLVTTIGYGNISPKTHLGKISTVIYALVGILLVVSWLKLVGDSLAMTLTKYYQRINVHIHRIFIDKHTRRRSFIHIKLYFQYERVPFWLSVTVLMGYLAGGSLLFSIWEEWSYIDGAYFSFITFTTIGFGDLVPGENTISNRNGRSILCAAYLLFGVMLTAMTFRLIQEDIDRVKAYLFRRLGIDHVNLPIIQK